MLYEVITLAGLAGVVDDVALGQDLRRFVLQEAQRLVQRPDGHAADLDRNNFV